MKYKCFCCGYRTLDDDPQDPSFEICPVCFWENDPIQRDKPDYVGGANVISLNQARDNFMRIGVSDERYKEHVRKPVAEEMLDSGA